MVVRSLPARTTKNLLIALRRRGSCCPEFGGLYAPTGSEGHATRSVRLERWARPRATLPYLLPTRRAGGKATDSVLSKSVTSGSRRQFTARPIAARRSKSRTHSHQPAYQYLPCLQLVALYAWLNRAVRPTTPLVCQ
jgi:hypothetical protein